MSSSHQIILTSSPDGPITAYDASSGTPLARFTGSRSPRRGLTFVGNSFVAASHVSLTSGSGSIHLYNWYSSTPSHNLPTPEPVAPLAASSDGSYIFTGGISGNIHVLEIPSGDIITSVQAHGKPVSCLGISEDGSVLISGGDDGKIVVTPIFQLVDESSDIDRNKADLTLHQFIAHDGSVTAIACCTSKIISCSMDSTCKIWSLLDGTHLQTLELPCEILGFSAAAPAADPTETRLYFAGSDGSIYKGSVTFGKRKQPKNQNYSNVMRLGSKHNSSVVSVVMVSEGRTLVSAAEDGSLFGWDTETGEIMMSLGDNGMGDSVSDMVVADRGRNRMNLFKADDGAELSSCLVDFGLSAKLLSDKMEETLDLEDVLVVAKKDRSKAIDMLESAIAMYEKLLELILREAQRESSVKGETGNVQKEQD